MKVVFIDRDGTMGGDGGGYSPKDFPLYEETIPAIKLLNRNSYSVIMITNQSRIARNYFTEEEFIFETNKMFDTFKKNGAEVLDYFFCPHHDSGECNCRKPKRGMVEAAFDKYPNIVLESCYFIGDNGQADMILADSFNIKKVLVKTGWGKCSLTKHRALWGHIEPDYIANDLLEASKWIINDK